MKSEYHPIWLILLMGLSGQVTQVAASEPVFTQDSDLLTSEQLVAAVLRANPKLEIAQAAWLAALARIDQQAAFEDPKFSYQIAPLTISDDQTNYGQRIEISQKLPWTGKLRLRNEALSRKADVSHQTINSVRLELSATARYFFADWYYIHRAIEINRHNQALLKAFRAITVQRYGTGLTGKQDALRADMEFALLEHQAIVLVRKRGAIRTRINTLLNQLPDSTLAQPSGLIEITPLPAVKLLQQQALQTRPELKAFAAKIEAAHSHAELMAKNNYPDISLKASYNSLWKNSSKHFMIGIGINLPLFRGKHRAADQEAQALITQLKWQQVDFIAKLREDIQIDYDRVQESLHVLSLYKNKLLPLARKILDASKLDYQSGKGDFLSLVSREKEYAQIRLQNEQALADTHRRQAELDRTVGQL